MPPNRLLLILADRESYHRLDNQQVQDLHWEAERILLEGISLGLLLAKETTTLEYLISQAIWGHLGQAVVKVISLGEQRDSGQTNQAVLVGMQLVEIGPREEVQASPLWVR